jgi:hypothetical protein
VICRYKEGVKVDAAAVKENLEARKRFPGHEPYAVIGSFPRVWTSTCRCWSRTTIRTSP